MQGYNRKFLQGVWGGEKCHGNNNKKYGNCFGFSCVFWLHSLLQKKYTFVKMHHIERVIYHRLINQKAIRRLL